MINIELMEYTNPMFSIFTYHIHVELSNMSIVLSETFHSKERTDKVIKYKYVPKYEHIFSFQFRK